MAARTDFEGLYRWLDLRAGCSVAELRRAYRRRVAELHPDRLPSAAADSTATAQLQELTAAYHAAMMFHRRYGRLPGAVVAVPPGHAERRLREPVIVMPMLTSAWRFVLAVSVLVALSWLLPSPDEPGGTGPEQATAAAGLVEPVAAPRAAPIGLGTDAARVLSIEGAPTGGNRHHWDYGASWLEFDDGRVSDWYSSPLHPLQVASPRPAHATTTPQPDPLD
ncbi:MAG: J domain-containing protein [Rhodanobacteraceae bacterium]|jgi:hypothetical protein|nr:J domain-containing protein [Rhodanobacteraceae bacterium]